MSLLRTYRRSCLSLGFGAVLLLSAPLALTLPRPARACGCFATTNVATPIVQAGEKILFVVDGGKIAMHVQIQYSGNPADFGWLVPLPAIPTNSLGNPGPDVGSVELFDQLETTTRPTYVLQRNPCFAPSSRRLGLGCSSENSGGSSAVSLDAGDPSISQPATPLVTQDSVGPYEFAILRADSKTEMLNWLSANRYVIPTGTDGVVGPYIRPGGYFLALRLKAGLSAGDIQPVVLRYTSDLPMVPITLTQVAATPNMGVLIWVLGAGRAVPRNYFHTVVNDAQIDWLDKASNYSDVVRQAVAEAQGKHAFVTEFSGSAERMRDVLDRAGRFSSLDYARTLRDPVRFVDQLLPQVEQPQLGNSIGTTSAVTRGFAWNGQLFAVLSAHIPMPKALVDSGVQPAEYYKRLDYYLNGDRKTNPSRYTDIEAKLAAFDPVVAAQDLRDRIVTPTLDAGALFRTGALPTLTRLYSVLSPEDMNLDPAFSFNRELPEVSNAHVASYNPVCQAQDRDQAELVITGEKGAQITRRLSPAEDEANKQQPLAQPYSQRIEQVADTGEPVIKVDNRTAITDGLAAVPGAGCSASSERRLPSGAGLLAFLGAGIAGTLLRRRPRRAT